MIRQLESDGAVYRITPRIDDPWELLLAEAAQLGRDRAASRSSARLDGFRVETLAQALDCKAPLLLRVDPSFLSALDADANVDACLRSIDARDGHVRLADGTRRPTIAADRDVRPSVSGEAAVTSVMPFAAREAITNGVTLVANNLVPRIGGALRAFTNDLSRATGAPAQVNLYLSERDAPGFGRHWDDHDVLILQCRGRKQWRLFAPTALSPRFGVTPTREFGASVFSTILEPGLALFIPRGWGHEVSGFAREVSLHYTIGLRYPTGCEILEGLRVTLPLQARRRFVDRDGDVWNSDFGRAELEHGLGAHRMRFTSAPLNGVLEVDAASRNDFADCRFVAPFPGGLVLFDSPQRRPGSIGFAAGGHHFEAPPTVVPMLARLLGGDGITVMEERETRTTDGNATRDLVLTLARRGLAEFTLGDPEVSG